jgi:hypothetical protein
MSYNSFRNDNNGAGEFALIQFRKSNNFASVAALDLLGQVLWSGYDAGTSTYKSASFIYCQAVGAPAANVPSELQFNTSFGTGTQLAMTIGQNGQVTINNPAANETTLFVTNNQTSANINLRTANATATNSPHIHFTRSRVGTADVNASDDLGRLEFRGFQGGTAIEAADIRAQAETVNGASVSGSLQFRTRPTTYAAINTRMNISADGNVTINAPVSGSSLTVSSQGTGNTITATQTGAGFPTIQCVQTSNDVQPVYFRNSKRRTGGTISAGDIILQIDAFGQNAGIDNFAAAQRFIAPTVGAGYVSGSIDWFTTSTAGALGQRMALSADGNVTINAPVSGTALTIAGGGETITAGNLTLSAGNINLTTTTSGASGVITAGGNRFIHNYGVTNTFVGVVSGNFTLTGTNNTGLGASTLSNVTSGTHNTALAPTALAVLTTGSFNTAVGQAYQSLVSGSNNIGIGYGAGLFITTGSYNIILGNYNDNGGQNYTLADSSNICIGNAGVNGQSNAIRIGISGSGSFQQNKCFIAGIDGVDVGSVAKVITMASDQLGTATITAGAGISVTPGANTITIASTNGIAWTEVTGTSQAMAVDSGYIANNAGLVTLTLPATAAVGDRVRIAGKGAGGWKCAQNAGQTINFGNTATTVGTGGSIDSTNQYDALELLCITANTTWVTLSSVGNLNVV